MSDNRIVVAADPFIWHEKRRIATKNIHLLKSALKGGTFFGFQRI